MIPVIIQDTREDEGTWLRWIGESVAVERGWSHPALKKSACLPTGDYCLPSAFSYDEAAGEVEFKPHRLIERKTAADFYGCCTSSRERFSAELIRMLDLKLQHGTYSVIVVEATWPAVLHYATVEHSMNADALRETVRAWERRFCPIQFCKSEKHAAWFALQFLLGGMEQ